MATVRLDDADTLEGLFDPQWKKDLSRIVPLLDRQRDALLRAYHTAVTSGGQTVGDRAGLSAYLVTNVPGIGRALVDRFLSELERGARAGTTPADVYDPSRGALAVLQRAAGQAAGTVANVGKWYQGTLTRIGIIAGIGLVGYLVVTGQLRMPKGR